MGITVGRSLRDALLALQFPTLVLFVFSPPTWNVCKVRDNTIKVIFSENQFCVHLQVALD